MFESISNPGPWMGAMEATIFTGWIYDFLKHHAVELKVAHPEMLKAITAAKNKNDRSDAVKLADLLRANLLPECVMMSEELRELRRILRCRNTVVRTAVTMKNKISGLLMEVGATYNKKKLHGKRYFKDLLESVEYVPDSVKELLLLSRGNFELFDSQSGNNSSGPKVGGISAGGGQKGYSLYSGGSCQGLADWPKLNLP